MNIFSLIISIVIGAVIGWVASLIMNSKGGAIRNILVGIVGSALGGWVASLIGISASKFSIGGILISIAGACLLIFIIKKLFK